MSKRGGGEDDGGEKEGGSECGRFGGNQVLNGAERPPGIVPGGDGVLRARVASSPPRHARPSSSPALLRPPAGRRGVGGGAAGDSAGGAGVASGRGERGAGGAVAWG